MLYITVIHLLLFILGCEKPVTENNGTASGNGNTAPVPEIFKKIYGATSISSDGNFVTIKTTGTPDHKSVYYASTHALYEAFSGTTFGNANFSKNPNSIVTQNYSFKIPINPTEAQNKQPTPLGPIGVAVNGVPFFNQYAGPNQPLTNEIVSFDQSWGHPAPGGVYHYHVEPLYLTQNKLTRSSLLGFLLDGFPVYGPEENGVLVQNLNLDAYHGHKHSTPDYSNGIYHYHITDKDPYLNGNGYFGTAGTVTR